MKLLIKLGGTLLDDAASRTDLAKQLAQIARSHEMVVVHGGGKQVTRYLEERGVTSRFVGGLRVSDEAVIDAVTKVIAGGVNKSLVSALIGAGASAVGISGVDGPLTTAVRLDPELGYVGKPDRSDGKLLKLFIEGGYTPVVACIAGDRQGNIYNVNADQMAVSCATGWHADKLLFLTDVRGVLDANRQLIAQLTTSGAKSLIETGVATGGMQAKLEAANSAVNGGIAEVIIAAGLESNVCERLLSGEQVGTRLRAEASAAASTLLERSAQ